MVIIHTPGDYFVSPVIGDIRSSGTVLNHDWKLALCFLLLTSLAESMAPWEVAVQTLAGLLARISSRREIKDRRLT